MIFHLKCGVWSMNLPEGVPKDLNIMNSRLHQGIIVTFPVTRKYKLQVSKTAYMNLSKNMAPKIPLSILIGLVCVVLCTLKSQIKSIESLPIKSDKIPPNPPKSGPKSPYIAIKF